MNEADRQPAISLGLAKVYLNAADPKLAKRTWQDVMDNILTKKTDDTLKRWQTAIKDKNFDCIRRCRFAKLDRNTRPGAGGWEAINQRLFATHPHHAWHGLAAQISHSAPAMAKVCRQGQTSHQVEEHRLSSSANRMRNAGIFTNCCG